MQDNKEKKSEILVAIDFFFFQSKRKMGWKKISRTDGVDTHL